jgi:ABC-type transport system involved in cytochrome c biogenesis permease subunit
MSEPDKQGQDRYRYAINMTMASVAGQVGCLTLIIVFAALFAGLWLDRQFGTRPMFTLGLILGSVPISLYLMFRVVKSATERIVPPQKKAGIETPPEENERE